jgi:hypothetical protein
VHRDGERVRSDLDPGAAGERDVARVRGARLVVVDPLGRAISAVGRVRVHAVRARRMGNFQGAAGQASAPACRAAGDPRPVVPRGAVRLRAAAASCGRNRLDVLARGHHPR